MATSPNPIVWDFVRDIDANSLDGLGGIAHYYDNEAQTLYLKNNHITTKTNTVENGHWEESELSSEIVLNDSIELDILRIDALSPGAIHGIAIDENGNLIYLRYDYAYDISNILTDWSMSLSTDNAINQISLSIDNIGLDYVGQDNSLFNPGARIPIKFAMGPSDPVSMGTYYVDEVSFSAISEKVDISARNFIGYFLNDRTIDRDDYTENPNEVIDWALENFPKVRVLKQDIQRDEYASSTKKAEYSINASDSYLSMINKVCEKYSGVTRRDASNIPFEGYSIQEAMDGTLVIGSDAFRSSKIANSTYSFNLGTDIFVHNISKNADSAYSYIRGTGKIDVQDFKPQGIYLVGDVVTFDPPEYEAGANYGPCSIVKKDDKYYYLPHGIRITKGFTWEEDQGWWQAVVVPEGSDYSNTDAFDPAKDYAYYDMVRATSDHVGEEKIYRCIKSDGIHMGLEYDKTEFGIPKWHLCIDEYDNHATYKIGDYCVHDWQRSQYAPIVKRNFRCVKDISEAKEWDEEDWMLLKEDYSFGNYWECIRNYDDNLTTMDIDFFKYRGHDDLIPIVLPVNHYSDWGIGEHKTLHVTIDGTMKQSEFSTWMTEQQKKAQYIGVNNQFDSPFRPQLLPGDVARMIDGDRVVDLGIITEVSHSYSSSDGTATSFTVDSGGEHTSSDTSTLYSKISSVNGYNRKQRLSDLVKIISKK